MYEFSLKTKISESCEVGSVAGITVYHRPQKTAKFDSVNDQRVCDSGLDPESGSTTWSLSRGNKCRNNSTRGRFQTGPDGTPGFTESGPLAGPDTSHHKRVVALDRLTG